MKRWVGGLPVEFVEGPNGRLHRHAPQLLQKGLDVVLLEQHA